MIQKIPQNVYRWAGYSLWLILAIGVTIAVNRDMSGAIPRTVTHHYRDATLHWIAGLPLYQMNGHGYLYLPQGAIAFFPWGILPSNVCEYVWRYSIILVAAWSAVRLTKLFDGDQSFFFAISLATVVLGMGTARVGQSTMMIMGLNILAIVELSERHWWRATIFLMVAFAFKPLGIVLILLVGAVRPTMIHRLAIGMIALVAFPFLTQSPQYVLSQYQDCVQSMKMTFHVGETEYWAQLFGMLKVIDIEPSASARTAIRLVFALATLFACWVATKNLSPKRSAFYLIAFSTFYVMLFHSRTEGNTYCMVGPIYGALLADAFCRRKSFWLTAFMDVAIIMTMLHFELGRRVAPVPKEVWVSPLVCVCVTCYLVFQWTTDLNKALLDVAEPKDLDERSIPAHELRVAA